MDGEARDVEAARAITAARAAAATRPEMASAAASRPRRRGSTAVDIMDKSSGFCQSNVD